jgi:di/tricarboxylate transporter
VTLQQGFAFGILGAALMLFAWGRLRYDLVALLALLAGIGTGIVPYDRAFTGFGDDIVIIVAAALIVSAAVARSGAVEALMQPVLPRLTRAAVQVPALSAAVMVASALSKNIGALAVFMPVAIQLGRKTGTPASALLMPMSFAALLGGLVTLVGTSPNIIVSRVREEVTGQPFRMFDYAPVGIGVALAGLLFLTFAWRLLPRDRQAGASMADALRLPDYATEAVVPRESKAIGLSVAEVEELAEQHFRVTALLREGQRHAPPPAGARIAAGDILLLEGEPEELERVLARAGLALDAEKYTPAEPEETTAVLEGVVTAESALVGRSAAEARLSERFNLSLLAVSRRGRSLTERLSEVRLRRGDVVILKGEAERVPEALADLGILPLTQRDLPLGRSRRSWLPAAILGAAILALAFRVAPVQVVFFAAAVLVLLTRSMTMREAYETMEWPLLVLLGALIPLSEAVRATGGTELLAGWIAPLLEGLPALATIAVIMAIAMAVTPFLNNAATVLVMGPIAAGLAARMGVGPDAFLMAVAIGAACDFLTPIGHQCNTLVMGPGGYRFADYPRLGAPLSLIVLAVGSVLVGWVWPVTPA